MSYSLWHRWNFVYVLKNYRRLQCGTPGPEEIIKIDILHLEHRYTWIAAWLPFALKNSESDPLIDFVSSYSFRNISTSYLITSMKVQTLTSHWLKTCLEVTTSFPKEITKTLDHIELGIQFSGREIHCWHFQSYCPFYSRSFFLWKWQPLNFPWHRPCCFLLYHTS